MSQNHFILITLLFISCGSKKETTTPVFQNITESIYASGIVKSKGQYEVYPNVSGIIDAIYVHEGDSVKTGDPILKIYNQVQELNKENAELSAAYSDYTSNIGKLNDAKLAIDLARNKMENDSLLYVRQQNLKDQELGSQIEFEQSQLNYHNSKNAFYSAQVRYNDLKRQIDFNDAQSKKNVQISSAITTDLTVYSKINGVIYDLNKVVGEMVNTQTVLAVIGDATVFELEMEVAENDILKVKTGQQVFVTLDSYRDQSFEGIITGIDPMMNQGTKTFTVKASFVKQPEILFPNMNFEANIIIQTKEKALLIPRNYLVNDSLVIQSNGDTTVVKTGLRDFKMVEILSGISENDALLKPGK
ncbi:MAG: efflux RND transporter periplasmic adaptor subunit [Bacteroidetes bacterium]|nr:efflux RND transporter periplasmic adaptor subunit [Bacteroidota bacterium]